MCFKILYLSLTNVLFNAKCAKIVLKNRLELTIISKILPLSGLKIVSTCDAVTRARLSHAESKFTPRGR